MEKTKTSWIDLYKKYGIYIFLVVVCAFFSVAAPNFLSASNLINILRQVSMFGIVVIGVTMVMIGGGMDLSVGGQMAVVGMVVGFLLVKLNLPIPVTALVGILTGIAFGTVNGIVAIKLKIMPIIVTLSTMLILQGVAYLITGGYPITGMPKPFLMLGQGYIGPIPIPVIIFVLFILFGWIVMNKTLITMENGQNNEKIVNTINYSTYAWSAENILYNVFGVRMTRNYYFDFDVRQLLYLISHQKKEELLNIKKLYCKLNKYVLDENDPLKCVLDEAKEYINNVECGESS
ncbi:ABC transporter permease [Hungatella hathewayi]|uniref:ABC transporter permease n=1 Tax=Hungatella hathewayi TaxID=154046 RepID=UPI003219C667